MFQFRQPVQFAQQADQAAHADGHGEVQCPHYQRPACRRPQPETPEQVPRRQDQGLRLPAG